MQKKRYKDIVENIEFADVTMSIEFLSWCLYLYYEKKVIILLDAYDKPLIEAYKYKYDVQMGDFMLNFLLSTFKCNTYMHKGIITGTNVDAEIKNCLNMQVVTTTSDKYATSFGFTEEEVFEALDECELQSEKQRVKEWYDGFTFGTYSDIYNPWSILNFLDSGNVKAYWANTSSNSLVGKLIREGNGAIKKQFEDLLRGDPLWVPVDEQIVYDQLDDNEEAVWSLLLASGYLKVIRYEDWKALEDGEEVHYELAITNREVRIMFESMVRTWFKKTNADYNDFVKAMLTGNRKAMNVYMNRVALSIFSYFDTGKRPSGQEPERFYHGFVLGLMVELQREYIVTSNRESGFGRYDVLIEPKNPEKNPAVIIEFKVYDEEDEKTLKETAQAALDQIEDKQYESTLLAKGVSRDKIYKYGFAFEGKTVWIVNTKLNKIFKVIYPVLNGCQIAK